MNLWERLNSEDGNVAASAREELKKDAREMGKSPQELMTALALHVQKIAKSRAAGVKFTDVLLDGETAIRKDADMDADDDEKKRKVKDADMDADDDEKKRKAKDADMDADDDSKTKIAGTTAKHSLRKGTFSSILPAVASYDIGEIEPSGPRAADDSVDAQGRAYSDVSDVRGEFYQTMGGLGSILPGGAGPQHDGYGGNADFAPLRDSDAMLGGETVPGGLNRPRPAGYALEAEGALPGTVAAYRVGESWALPGRSGMGAASEAVFPSAKTSPVLKSETPERAKARPKGFWPKDITSTTPSDPTK